MYTLTFEHLTKRYGREMVVNDLSFVVQPGRVTGFLGPNGAGKSTVMKMLLDLARPTAGRADFDGRRPATSRILPVQSVSFLSRTRSIPDAAGATICLSLPMGSACPRDGWTNCSSSWS